MEIFNNKDDELPYISDCFPGSKQYIFNVLLLLNSTNIEFVLRTKQFLLFTII